MKIAGGIAAISATAAIVYTAQTSFSNGSFLAREMSPVEQEFAQYLAKFGKTYLSEEEHTARLANFAKTHFIIEEHNAAGKSWTLAHNFMSDWSETERQQLNGFVPREREESEYVRDENLTVASSIDWTKKYTRCAFVKDQGKCGSCWAFSTCGSIECQSNIHLNKEFDLSEQQLVDCSYWNNGCNGGNFDFGFDYEQQNGGESEQSYPYTAKNGKCQYNSKDVVAKVV